MKPPIYRVICKLKNRCWVIQSAKFASKESAQGYIDINRDMIGMNEQVEIAKEFHPL